MRSRLYQGGDHLLLVYSTGYTEEYKRVAYQNIRYVVVRRTHGREQQAMLSGLLLVLVGLLYFAHVPWGVVVVMVFHFLSGSSPTFSAARRAAPTSIRIFRRSNFLCRDGSKRSPSLSISSRKKSLPPRPPQWEWSNTFLP